MADLQEPKDNSKITLQQIWEKANIVKGYEPSLIRKDSCGAWILRGEYANRDSEFGWEVDHVFPLCLGGKNDEINLRPMQWKNNVAKGDDYPDYQTAVIAKDDKNIDQKGNFKVNEMLQKELQELYNYSI